MNKKRIVLTVLTAILLFVLIAISCFLFNKFILKSKLENSFLPFAEKNENTIFSINKVTFFSSCDAKNKTATSSNFTIENLYQYTDMAFFINTPNSEKTLENTFKKVYIDDIKYEQTPLLGEPQLYYKNINNFAKSDIYEENLVNDKLEFEITSEDEADLNKPTLYNNLANPIVLSYVNSNIKNDYTITDTSKPITYDGSLLKSCNVLTNNIACKFSFDVYITNNLDQEFKTTVYVDLPLETEEKSIYNGNVTLNQDTNFIFYRYK